MISIVRIVMAFSFMIACATVSEHPAQEDVPNVTIRAQTENEAFDYLLKQISKMSFFQKNGYQVSLPDHETFKKLSDQPEKLQLIDLDALREVFETEVYSPSSFSAGLSALNEKIERIEEALKLLPAFKRKWGFRVFPRYEIILTLYGPGGSYDPEAGSVIMLTRPDGTFKQKNTAETVVHEIVHIGIEQNIVSRFRLSHWEKERVVDLICKHSFKNVFSSYTMNSTGDRRIDRYLNEKTMDDPPSAVEKYITHYPR